jgi:hypothetical protein
MQRFRIRFDYEHRFAEHEHEHDISAMSRNRARLFGIRTIAVPWERPAIRQPLQEGSTPKEKRVDPKKFQKSPRMAAGMFASRAVLQTDTDASNRK